MLAILAAFGCVMTEGADGILRVLVFNDLPASALGAEQCLDVACRSKSNLVDATVVQKAIHSCAEALL